MTTIYHNPRCGKSRQTLKILHERGENVTIVEYLKVCPDYDKLKSIVAKLGIPAEQLIRKSEAVYKENYKGKEMTEDDYLHAMAAHPILIERPIVIKDERAALGRPPERVEDIL
jgi:arsenate reductase